MLDIKQNMIINKLREYANQVDLNKRYNWDYNDELLIKFNIIGEQAKHNNQFEKNICLKHSLSEYLKQNNGIDILFWIINIWGGIKNFKNTDSNIKKIERFREQLKNKCLSRDTFSTISSLSKLSSFWNCGNYVIYDSRVIFSLNWLILKYAEKKKYFPQPLGRNSNISRYNLDTIIRLYHQKDDEFLYYHYKEAYFVFCDTIKILTKEVWNNLDKKPYYLEMLLFTISETEIIDDIKESLSIKIKCPTS